MEANKYTIISEPVKSNILAVKRVLHLTNAKIGEATGISGSTVSTYITGCREADVSWFDRFCEVYHLDTEWFYHGTGEPIFTEKPTSLETKNTDGSVARLRAVRKKLQLNQTEAAEKIGISRQHYSKIERGLCKISDRVAEKIEDGFGVGKEWLMYGNEARKTFPISKGIIDFLWDNESERKRLWKMIEKKKSSPDAAGNDPR